MVDYLKKYTYYGLDEKGGKYFHELREYLARHKTAIETDSFTDFVKLVRTDINTSPLEDRIKPITRSITSNYVHWFDNLWVVEDGDRDRHIVKKLDNKWNNPTRSITGGLEAKLFVAIINFSVKYKELYNDWKTTQDILEEIFDGKIEDKEYITYHLKKFNSAKGVTNRKARNRL